MAEKIVLALFVSLSCFGLYARSEWIIIEDLTVEDQYFNTQFAKLRETHSSDLQSLDQFKSKTSEEFENICSQLKNTKIYRRIPLTRQFPKPTNLEKLGESKGSNYQYTSRPLKLNIGELAGEISVFPCETHPGRTYWLTYGYSESTILLLQEVDGGKAVSFVGWSVVVPTIDGKYPYKGETLDTYFWLTIEKAIAQRKIEPANLYTDASQFHLCCVVHAARQRTHPEKESFTLNYANNDAITTVFPPMNRKISDSEYRKINLRSIGCVINRKEAEIDFYIRGDSEDPRAMFVLEEEKDALVVAERIQEIPPEFHYSIRYN